MRKLLFILLISPNFMFASFPVSDYEYSDTIVIDGSKYIEVGVDSLYKLPLPDEDLSEYRVRLKKYNIQNSQNSLKAPITFWQIILIIGIVFLIIFIFILSSVIKDLSIEELK